MLPSAPNSSARIGPTATPSVAAYREGTGMRTRTKLVLLVGLSSASMALMHCVGDSPDAAVGTDAGADSSATDSGSPDTSTGDSGNPGDAGADSGCANGASQCIVQIAGGGQSFCARDNLGKVYCWGDNRSGQLAQDPTTVPYTGKPLAVDLGTTFALSVGLGGTEAASSGGGSVGCARVTVGANGTGPATVYCWGSNNTGQAGQNPDASSTVDRAGYAYIKPTMVPNLTGITNLAVGALHSCALETSGGSSTLSCWGDNSNGELARPTPGSFDPLPQPVTFFNATGVVINDVAVGARHTCSVNSAVGDRVGCAGINSAGELGRGDTTNDDQVDASEIFAVTAPLDTSVQVASAGKTTCVINPTTSGVSCWGDNTFGQLGNTAAGANADVPTQVTSLTGTPHIDGLQAGYDHFCALVEVPTSADGAVGQNVFCWGSNAYGETQPATVGTNTLTAAAISGLPDRAVSLAMGSQASCALLKDDSVWCWGEDYLGELGNADDGGDSGPASGPVQIKFF